MSNYSIYVSHSIRGMKGADATHEDMLDNNLKAMEFGKELRLAFPDIDFYVPAEHDEFVLVAYEKNYLTENAILSIDCHLVNSRDMVLAWAPDQFISHGMMTELLHASLTGKEITVIRDIHEARCVINAILNRRIS